jgi:hypothetical protein
LDGDDGVNTPATFYFPSSTSGASLFAFNSGDNYFELRNLTFSGGSTYKISVDIVGANNIDIHDSTFNMAGIYAIHIENGASNINIYNNTLTWTGSSGSTNGVTIKGANTINIYNNSFYDWAHNSIEITNSNDDSGYDSHTIKIYNNYNDSRDAAYSRFFGISGQFANKSTYDVWIYNNWIEQTRASNQIKGNTDTIYVYHNVFNNALNCCDTDEQYGCSKAYEYSCNATYGNGTHITLNDTYGDLNYAYIYNNVFGFSNEAAIRINTVYSGTITFSLTNNIFYNNANCNAGTNAPQCSLDEEFDSVIYWRKHSGGSMSEVTIENNLIYDVAGLTYDINWGSASDCEIAGSPACVVYATIANFESASPSGVTAQNNDTDNPDFTDASNSDFTLTADSPAIDMGKDLGVAYENAWDPDTDNPPQPVNTANQDVYGEGWETGVFVYKLGFTAPDTGENKFLRGTYLRSILH